MTKDARFATMPVYFYEVIFSEDYPFTEVPTVYLYPQGIFNFQNL
jgi:hypothetical protein